MKVLFQIRPDYLKNPAGDTIQLLYTGYELKKLGLEIQISSNPNILLTPFDLIHIFNITRIKESYLFFLNAQKQQKTIIISPIYWNPSHYLQHRQGSSRNLASWNLNQTMRARLIRECNYLLPNGENEIIAIQQDFPHSAAYKVIPNGFPDSFVNANPALIHEKFPNLPDHFILCVARISQRKNQHWLAKACADLALPLILVGPINDKKYYSMLNSFTNVTYLGVLQGELLASAYAAAQAHALPSWFETPGLSSLEAGACGTIVLSTDQGCTQEYFKDLAIYANPFQPDSLRLGLEKSFSWSAKPLTEHIHNNYPWSKVAQLTYNVYQECHTRPSPTL